MLTDSGDGILLYLGGGERPHIGTVVICEPRPSMKDNAAISCTTSVINRLSHKDDSVIVPIAEAVCRKTGKVVVATGGAHIENPEEADIKKLIDNAEEIKIRLLDKIGTHGEI